MPENAAAMATKRLQNAINSLLKIEFRISVPLGRN